MLSSSTRWSICVPIQHSFDHLVRERERERSETMIWVLRVWGISSVVVLLTILLASIQSWSPAEAVRSSRYDFAGRVAPLPQLDLREFAFNRPQPMSNEKSGSFMVFQEAPAFRNGIECFSRPGGKQEAVCDSNAVHIAMTLDATYLRGSMAAAFSVVKHAACPENIVFHFLVSHGDIESEALMRSTFPYLRVKIYNFDEMLVKNRISLSVRPDLEQPLNYARNYLADIVEPCVERVIYLDSDLVVVDDIARLWNTSLGSRILGAPEYCHANFTKYFTDNFWSNRNLSSTFDGRSPCYFNTGVMIMDLVKWRQHNCTKRIELWMDIQKERRIYELGSLPPFLLVFSGSIEAIEHRWNQHGLGGDNVVGSCRSLHPGPVSLLHWSGKGKPWLRLDSGRSCPLDSLWAPYDLFVDVRRTDS